MKMKAALIFLLGLILVVFTNCGVPLGVREELVWENNLSGGRLTKSVDAFATHVYPITRNHCISCHSVQEPIHASDDVKTAHDSIISQFKVNSSNLADSRMVMKLREGHNCWSDCQEDADEILAGLKKWKAIKMAEAPKPNPPVTPPTSETVSYTAFKEHVYPITRARCVSCHYSNAIEPVHAAADYEIAHDALIQQYKVNFSNLPSSRIVAKLRDEGHNCWSNCQQNAQEMLAGVEKWYAAIQASNGGGSADPVLVGLATGSSRTLKLELGQENLVSLTFDLSGILKQPGISFVVNVEEYDEYSIKFSSPRIEAPAGVRLKVKNIKLHLNGIYIPKYAAFSYIDTISSGDNPLAPFPMVVEKVRPDLQDKVAFTFDVLELAD